ncbi:hypothetical protein KD050_04895 [Psychrobacillus sp. INOP01]|uniref:hypothetical protein n=1 Tax=Psychrobacillus sp. INOP01 TaxID=2829187 RepID=UPI001BA9CEBD|nr:hypothetical protein [Psychrobacillus sp. INOP01]QUG42614.1 hypothetical protein KD050_04895 [Psychrobacillus sp. INOP01]
MPSNRVLAISYANSSCRELLTSLMVVVGGDSNRMSGEKGDITEVRPSGGDGSRLPGGKCPPARKSNVSMNQYFLQNI